MKDNMSYELYRIVFIGDNKETLKKEKEMIEKINNKLNFKKKCYLCFYWEDNFVGIVDKKDFMLFINRIAPVNERGNFLTHMEVEIEPNGTIKISTYDKDELVGYYTLKDISLLDDKEKKDIINKLSNEYKEIKRKIKENTSNKEIMSIVIDTLIHDLDKKIELS